MTSSSMMTMPRAWRPRDAQRVLCVEARIVLEVFVEECVGAFVYAVVSLHLSGMMAG